MESLHQPEPIRGGLYVVGYFDLLGQSNALLPYVDVEGSQEYLDNIKRAFARIVSQVHAFRDDIKAFFDGAQSESLVASAPAGTPSAALAMAADLESEQIKLQGFSDTVVAYVPIATKSGEISLYRVGAMLISVACTMLFSIARGAIARGAIEASWAMEPFDGEVYGPALMCAHHLESKADWPRVVLGSGIQKLWHKVSNRSLRTNNDKMNYLFARLQADLSFKDVDGKVAVDYLGPTMRALIADATDDLPALIDAAHVELDQQHMKYANDAKVASKLRSALNYFDSRAGVLTVARRESAKAYARLRHQN